MSRSRLSMEAAEALPSSTVALVRNTASGPELLLVLRHSRTSFGDSYVFPGGILESQDYEISHLSEGVCDADANRLLALPDGALAYYSAAVRELFEEAGVLLARDSRGQWASTEGLEGCRSALHAGELAWPAFLAERGLKLACDALHYFAFWITPREMPKRFSTRFFVAELPEGQVARHCGTELTDSRWLSARSALAESAAAGLKLPHPTQVTLETLGRFDDATTLIDWARCQAEAGVPCRLPAIISVGGKPRVVMPDDQLYPNYPDECGQAKVGDDEG